MRLRTMTAYPSCVRSIACRLRTLAVATVLVASCTTPPPQPTLYERMGGNATIVVIVDETIDEVASDPRTKRSFDGVNMKKLKQSIVMQLCVLAGGPCKYEGETMHEAHKGLKITAAEFDLMVAELRLSLDRHVATPEKNELLRLLAPMKRDVVTS